MANATARVARAFRSVRDEILTHSWGTLSSKTTLYTGAMVGLTAGYLAKFDDTAAMTFFGVISEDLGNPVLPSDGTTSATAGAASLGLDIRQPPAFELNIASVAITDIGRRVYALDDQTGTLDPSATTYANLIGTVKDLIFATDGGSPVANYALVVPAYNQPRSGLLQVLTTASPVVPIKAGLVILNKAGVIAATMADPTTGVHDGLQMSFVSVVAQAHTLITPGGFNGSGTTATWGGAKGDSVQLVAYSGKWYSEGGTRNVNFT